MGKFFQKAWRSSKEARNQALPLMDQQSEARDASIRVRIATGVTKSELGKYFLSASANGSITTFFASASHVFAVQSHSSGARSRNSEVSLVSIEQNKLRYHPFARFNDQDLIGSPAAAHEKYQQVASSLRGQNVDTIKDMAAKIPGALTPKMLNRELASASADML